MDIAARITFQDLSREELDQAVVLLSRGMRDNPIIVRAFGDDTQTRLRRLSRFYANAVPSIERRGGFLGAFFGGKLVGVVGVSRPGCCRPPSLDVLLSLPSTLKNNHLAGMLRIGRWLDAWDRHEPREAHWHVRLLSVEPSMQGLGVGTRLMAEHCARMDQLGTTSYLETDKSINVRFYQKLGYQIVAQEPVLDVTNWFLTRKAAVPQTRIDQPQPVLPNSARSGRLQDLTHDPASFARR